MKNNIKKVYGERVEAHFKSFGLTMLGKGNEFITSSSKGWSGGAVWGAESIQATLDGLRMALKMLEIEKRDPGSSRTELAKIALNLPLGITEEDKDELLGGAWEKIIKATKPAAVCEELALLMRAGVNQVYEIKNAQSVYFNPSGNHWGMWIEGKDVEWIEARVKMSLKAFEAFYEDATLCGSDPGSIAGNVNAIAQRIGASNASAEFLARVLALLHVKGHAGQGLEWMLKASQREGRSWEEVWTDAAKLMNLDVSVIKEVWGKLAVWSQCGITRRVPAGLKCSEVQSPYHAEIQRYFLSFENEGFEAEASKLLIKWNSEEELLEQFYINFSEGEGLDVKSWAHVGAEVTDLVLALKNKDIKVLIWGEPGAGKSALAGALARAAGKIAIAPAKLSESQSASSESELGYLRLRRVQAAERLGKAAGNAMLVIDECESILKGEKHKIELCEELEGREFAQIWIANKLTNIHEAFLRRFDFVLKVPAMPLMHREALAVKLFPGAENKALAARLARSMRNPAELVAARDWCEAAGVVSWSVVARRMAGHQHALSATAETEEGSFMEVVPAGSGDTDAALAEFAGSPRLRGELTGIARMFAEPERFARLGAKMPKGYLLAGPPGSGKTLFVRVLAKMAGVPVVVSNGAALASEPKRFARLFAEARKRAPCLVFIDEFDVCAGNARVGGQLNLDRQKILNHLLVELDGFDPLDGVMFLGATHNGNAVDPSVTRAGRLGRTLSFTHPDPAAREEVWRAHLSGPGISDSLNWARLARASRGFSCAEIAAAAERARLDAATAGHDEVGMDAAEAACDIIYWGEAKDSYLDDASRWILAVHEAGHAMVASSCGYLAERATVRPRGEFLGAVSVMPAEGSEAMGPIQAKALLMVNLAGYAAEIAMFGTPTVGAGADMHAARELLASCLLDWGVGANPLAYAGSGSGRELSQSALESYEERAGAMMEQALGALAVMFAPERGLIVLKALASELLDKREMGREEIEACLRRAEGSLAPELEPIMVRKATPRRWERTNPDSKSNHAGEMPALCLGKESGS